MLNSKGDLMKKVMVVIPALGSGGGERLAISIISKMDIESIHTKLVVLYKKSDSDNTKFVESMGIDTVYLNKKRGVDLSIISKLKKIINQFKPDVIQTHLYTVSYVLFAAPRNIIKYHTVHNIAQREATGMRRIINFFAFHYGNFIPIAISQYCAETIRSVYHLKRNEFPCIENGVDLEKYYFKPIPHQGIKFINVGRLQPQKNQELLIKAFSKIHEKAPNTILQIVGAGELQSELKELTISLGIDQYVEFAGQCSDILMRLNSSDIFIQTSDFEGLPISLLESMACGLPIVATRAGGTIDVVCDGVNGFLVDIRDEKSIVDKSLKLINDVDLRKKMSKNSRELIKKYSIEVCAKNYEKLYLKETS